MYKEFHKTHERIMINVEESYNMRTINGNYLALDKDISNNDEMINKPITNRKYESDLRAGQVSLHTKI